MHPRPTYPRRTVFPVEHVKRDGRRHLSFEVLENRTLLTADLPTIEVRLAHRSAQNAPLTVIQGPAQTSASANGYVMEMVNTTSPAAAEPSVDDVIVLRVLLADDANQAAMTTRPRLNVTFDPNVVELDASAELLQVSGSFASAVTSGKDGQIIVDQFYRARSHTADDVVFEVPFRVVAPGYTNLSAAMSADVAVVVDYTPYVSDSSVVFEHSVSGGGGIARSIGPAVAPGWKATVPSETGQSTVLELRETIRIEQPRRPLLEAFPAPDENPPFARVQSLLPDEPAISAKATATSMDMDAPRSSTLLLSSDSVWNRHRSLLVGDGEPVARRLSSKSSVGLTSRLTSDIDTRVSRHDSPGFDLFPAGTRQCDPGRTFRLGTSLIDMTASETEEDVTHRIAILRPEECDAVIANWGTGSNAAKPPRTPSVRTKP